MEKETACRETLSTVYGGKDIAGIMDIIEEKVDNITNKQKRSCKTVYGVQCPLMFKECTTSDSNDRYWCDIEKDENGTDRCAADPCDGYHVLGDISDDILQPAFEMYTYIASCPAKERV